MALEGADSSSLQKLADSLGELRDITHQALATGQPGPDGALADVEALLREIYSVQKVTAERQGLELKLDVCPPLPKLRRDPLLVDRCVGNLVTNAIKYTLKGAVTIGRWWRKSLLHRSGSWLRPDGAPAGSGTGT